MTIKLDSGIENQNSLLNDAIVKINLSGAAHWTRNNRRYIIKGGSNLGENNGSVLNANQQSENRMKPNIPIYLSYPLQKY